MFKNWLACFAVIFLCAGCPSPGPGRFGNPGDGGDDIGSMPDIASGGEGGGGAGDVTGTAITTWITDAGPVTRSVDLSKLTIAALVPAGPAWDTNARTRRARGPLTLPY